ncbi:MAG: adenylate/guanylate cyclase domain-containing protein [Solirubrobacteraceae bacterium]
MTPNLARQVHIRLKLIGIFGSVVGALVTFLAVGFLFLAVGGTQALNVKSGWVNAPVIALFLLASAVVFIPIRRRHIGEALGWLAERRPPDEREHELTLGLAAYSVKLDAIGWSLAAVTFAVFNGLAFSWGLGAVVAATIWFGGETTCALSYLLYERALRPVMALALASRPPTAMVAPGVRLRLAMAWLLGTGVPLIGVLVLGVIGAAGWTHNSKYVGAAVLFLAIVATCTGFLATMLAARAIADPLTGVRRGVERIAMGDLDVHVEVDDGSEVGQLQAGFNRMADGLRERERIRDLFGRQVGQDVAKAALSEGIRLGGEEREIAALFVDVVGSTSLALAVPPSEVVRLLNRFFRIVVEAVEAEGGLVNKFEGDAALCVFGAPVAREDATGDSLRTARNLAGRLSRELPEIDFGIGVSAGVAVAGNVGAEHRFEYTVIGDPVNEACRLAELAKERPERVLSSSAALDRASETESGAWAVTESAVLRGRLAPTELAHPELQTS